MENEQLRREATMKRITVAQAVEDIKVGTYLYHVNRDREHSP